MVPLPREDVVCGDAGREPYDHGKQCRARGDSSLQDGHQQQRTECGSHCGPCEKNAREDLLRAEQGSNDSATAQGEHDLTGAAEERPRVSALRIQVVRDRRRGHE